jgi:hypothetical protein
MVFHVVHRTLLEQPDGFLKSAREVELLLTYERGQWRAKCRQPPVATLRCDSLEEAFVTAAREVCSERVR